MGYLDDMMDIDAVAFTDTDTFGETVTYKPFGSSSRSIKAVVNRRVDDAGNAPRVRMILEIDVANDSTTGILLTSIDFNLDRVSVASLKGGTAQDRAISPRITSQDSGMLRLELV